MIAKLLTEHHLELLCLNGGFTLSLHLSKCHIVGNHISRLISAPSEDTAGASTLFGHFISLMYL